MKEISRTRWTLIDAARSGDEEAQRRFVRKYRRPTVAYLRACGLGSGAEDVAQEVFLRLFQDGVLDKADPSKGKFRSLLLAVTKNLLGKHLRAERAEKRGGGAVQSLGDRQVSAPQPDEAFEREWLLNILDLCMARLEREHPHYHGALSRFLLEGRNQTQVAEAMGKSARDVRNYVHRGKQKLVAYMREEAWNYSASRTEYAEEIQHLSRLLARR